MKKAYSKPQIMFDSFELSQSIAAGCSYITDNHDLRSCGILDTAIGLKYFADFLGNPCNMEHECYELPTLDGSVFSS